MKRDEFNSHPYIAHAGKVTVFTTLFGVTIFLVAFFLNVGHEELQRVEAQSTATTSVTVLNTPPQWDVLAYELNESSTSTPTNSGDDVVWAAVASDSNAEPYQLIVCNNNATPTPGTSTTSPQCAGGGFAWAVSPQTASGVMATTSTTTLEAFAESNDWYAWICDAIDLNARCNGTFSQGLNATNSSPFIVNHRPTFTAYSDDSPAVPGATVTFTTTSSDTDTVGGNDTIQLVVCNDPDYDTATNACGAGGTIATSTFVTTDASATYTIVIPTQDQNYTAYGYIVDEHGHEATGGNQGTDSTLTVDNIAPTVAPASIIINGGSDIVLTQAAGETTGFTLDFTATDNNSCENASAGDEVVDYTLSFYRSGIGSTTCDALTGIYNPNSCYPSGVGTTTWNVSCTASSTSCGGATDTTVDWSCSFPLWYVADPTDGGATNTVHFAEDWQAAVRAIDDNNASNTPSQAISGQELNSLLAFALNTDAIPYGELEPGQDSTTLSATTSIAATGNVGIDQRLTGESMCPTYTPSTPCESSATSTIPESEQEFATSSLAYGSGTALSSSTQQELELNVLKPTSTSTQTTGTTYWGIAVPGSITLAGLYTGENTFFAVTSEPGQW
jgi:hypothetical protein